MRLAIFDLDGTITRHDTLLAYVLGFLARHPWRVPRLLGALLPALRYTFDHDRGKLKSSLIRATLGGVSRAEIARWNASFIRQLLARRTFTMARERIRAHQSAGDHLVLMSASVNLYVPDIGAALGFAETICTELRWQADRVDGRLLSPNRRGEEKVRCLTGLRSSHPGLRACAYGNAASDLAHLSQVEEAVLVNGSPAAQALASQQGVRCEHWQ